MTTQIMFKIDPKLKKAAQKRAKEEGITLSDFYQLATRSFVEERLNVSLTMSEDTMALKEYKSGKNIGPFKSVSALRKSLEE